ncbi:MAG: hypothetical protein JWQ09_124 [Segetibacter sp.]|nr:hypothetical protein [Segetibacter sp.]
MTSSLLGEAVKRIEALPKYKWGQFQNLDQEVQPATVATPRKPKWLRLLKFFTGQPKKVLFALAGVLAPLHGCCHLQLWRQASMIAVQALPAIPQDHIFKGLCKGFLCNSYINFIFSIFNVGFISCFTWGVYFL